MPLAKGRKRRSARASAGLTFNHAMLYSRDVAQAVYFYVDLLGFRLIEQVGHGGMLVYARIRSPRGSSTLALHLLEPGKTLPVDDAVRLYFEVRNVGAMCKKLQATGVKLLGEPKVMPWGWKHAYLKDPDGHELSLYWAGPKRFRKTMSG